MKNVTRHTGVLTIVGRCKQSSNGNPRYICTLDGYTCRTMVDDTLSYELPKFDGKIVTALIGSHYGTITIDSVKEVSNMLVFQESTNTIRQIPENYLIAYNRGGRWISEPDLAANKELCVRVYKELFKHSAKYGTGTGLIARLNK